MPFYKDVKEFSKKLANELKWKIIDESKPSRVVLISKDASNKLIKF
jgi:wyosine [tRNA(Phe)-imidazoG37] synthetase (radical SAM superfamily)